MRTRRSRFTLLEPVRPVPSRFDASREPRSGIGQVWVYGPTSPSEDSRVGGR